MNLKTRSDQTDVQILGLYMCAILTEVCYVDITQTRASVC